MSTVRTKSASEPAQEQSAAQREEIARLEADLAARGLEDALSAASGGDQSRGAVARLEAEKAAALAAAARLERTVEGLRAAAADRAAGPDAESDAIRRTAETEAAGRRLAEAKSELEARRNAHLQLELAKAKQTVAQLGEAVQRMQVTKEHLEADLADLELQEVAHEDALADLENQKRYILLLLILFGLVTVALGLVTSGVLGV